MNERPKVALVYGFWGQNIGNAFFNVGGKALLSRVFPGHEIVEVPDQPGYRTFHKQSAGNPKNAFPFLEHIRPEYVVLQGPMLTRSFRALWEPSFRVFREMGVKVALISAGFFRYDEDEVSAVQSFLSEFPPDIVSTRDAETHRILEGIGVEAYSGIDSAFFCPLAYEPLKLEGGPFIAVNFDQFPEPRLRVLSAPDQLDGANQFQALDREWQASFPRGLSRIAGLGQWQCYCSALLDRRPLADSIDGISLIRLEHRTNPFIRWKVFQRGNSYAADEPYTYLSVYANAPLTLTDRVHACVASLAYGNQAMLFHPTPRAHLLGRVGAGTIREKPTSIDMQWLDDQRRDQIVALQGMASAQ